MWRMRVQGPNSSENLEGSQVSEYSYLYAFKESFSHSITPARIARTKVWRKHNILILKGTFLGLGIFVIVSVCYLVAALTRLRSMFPSPQLKANEAVGVDLSTFSRLFMSRPGAYVAFLACIILGVAIVGSWPRPGHPVDRQPDGTFKLRGS